MEMFPATIIALCPEPRSYQIETPEGITYRRTQNHLKPFKSPQKIQMTEQYQQQCPKRTLLKNDSNKIQLHPKRQIKVPAKLNL